MEGARQRQQRALLGEGIQRQGRPVPVPTRPLAQRPRDRTAAAAAYIPSPPRQARFDAAVASNPENKSVKGPSKKAKSSKGPQALSAYMHFCNERRPGLTTVLKAQFGAEFKNKLVMVNLGSEWRELSDDGKAKFVKMNEAQKADMASQAAKMS